MSARTRLTLILLGGILVASAAAVVTADQGRGRAVPEQRSAILIRGQVFIGGYFYDPAFGRYPWWRPPAYPYRYYPVFDYRGEVHIKATPKEAGVYVDGFYAGIVDDFDGVFQELPLTPGGHEIVLYLEGYRTAWHRVYLGPGASITLREALEPLPEGQVSERPRLAPPVPPPPPGTFRQPRTPSPLPPPPAVAFPEEGCGTLTLRVLPPGAEVRIDGQRWVSSNDQVFVVDLPAGRHTIEAALEGYQPYSTTVEIREGENTTLNISLARNGG